MSTTVYSVHVNKPAGGGAIEIVFTSEKQARDYAQDRSCDFQIVSASVTSFAVGELGTRHPVAWYVDGKQQPRRYDRQLYPTDGSRTDHQ